MGLLDVLAEKGLELPPEIAPPPGFSLPFRLVRLAGDRAFVSGHPASAADGSLGPFGNVPSVVSLGDAPQAARLTGLAMVGSLERALGDLDRIHAWLMVSGFVNAEPGFAQTTQVMNAFSGLIIELFGPEVGGHARSAIGVASLPVDACLVISAELQIGPA